MSSNQCSLCFFDSSDNDENNQLFFIKCSGDSPSHFFCHECIKRFFNEQIIQNKDKKVIECYKNNKKIICPLIGHCNNCILEDEIFVLNNRDIIKSFYKSHNILDLEILEKQYSDREKKFIESVVNDTIQEQNNKQIVKTLLCKIQEILSDSIACPYCKKTFVDFSGCMALMCGTCDKEFCGVCMKIHSDQQNNDAHQSVLTCVNSLPNNIKEKYGLNGYFMNGNYWESWKERIQINEINNYLKTLHKEVVLKNYNLLLSEIKKLQLLTLQGIDMLSEMVFSHDMDSVHLIRIPNVYWLIYSTKHNVKFEDAVNFAIFNIDDRMTVGLKVISEIRKLYPNWKDVKKKVPGENFMAINYPPEFMGIIAKVIDEWGINNKIWSKFPETTLHKLPKWSRSQ